MSDLVSIKDFIFNKTDIESIEKINEGHYRKGIIIKFINGSKKEFSYNGNDNLDKDFHNLLQTVSTVPLKEHCENLSIHIQKLEKLVDNINIEINKRMNAIVSMYNDNRDLMFRVDSKIDNMDKKIKLELKEIKALKKKEFKNAITLPKNDESASQTLLEVSNSSTEN